MAGLACVTVAPPAWALEGVVVRVSDGDTFWLRTKSDKHPLRVRLHGIDAPELCQSGGAEARQALEALVLGRHVVVRSRAPDRWGRRLAQVLSGKKDVAEQLTGQGWAWSDNYRGQPGPYAVSERAARESRRGLFAQPGAVPPRVFRQEHGPCIGLTPATRSER
jgi:endonuclease YncB( thermonuclease family)